MRLSSVLTEMKAQGVAKAKASFNAKGEVLSVEVEFAPEPVPVGGFVDRDGKPIDLGEDLPPLARDPIASANYRKGEPDA